MLIAVASNGFDVAPLFSQCQNFNYYTTQSFEIAASQNLPAQGLTDAEYAPLMAMMGIDVIICNTLSAQAQDAFEGQGISVVTGASGRALDAARAYIDQRAQDVLANADFAEDD